MLSHVFIVIGFVTATLSANTGYPPAPTYSCANNNELKCCNSKSNAGSPSANGAGLLTVVGNILVPVSASCTNVNAIGLLNDGSKCQNTISCCNKNNQNGLVNVQCTPLGVQV